MTVLKIIGGIIATLVVIALAVVSALWVRDRPAQLTDFYLPPYDLEVSATPAPGAVVRLEKLDDNPAGVEAWRLIYLSTQLDGSLQPVSGILAYPSGQVPAGGWPVIGMAHPTVGLGRGCAPSLQPRRAIRIPQVPEDAITLFDANIVPLVRQGYAVVQSDYFGLGVPGLTNYMVAPTEMSAVLDSVRALRNSAVSRFSAFTVIWGHSQGGNAALFAAAGAARYAPDIPLAGIVLLAPSTDLSAIFQEFYPANTPGDLTGLGLLRMVSYGQVYPQVQIRQLVAPAYWQWIPITEQKCHEAVTALKTAPPQAVFTSNPATNPVTGPLLQQNSPQPGPLPAPVFVGQGLADTIVNPAITNAFQQGLVAAGNTVTYTTYPGVGHLGVPAAAQANVAAWLRTLPGSAAGSATSR